jgi:sugar-specific transcriptional regulator TrmB
MDMDENLLPLLGMTSMQAKVYLAALELGEASMQNLASKSGVNRSTIYTFIDELRERGYINEIKRGKRHVFSAVNPERLVEMQKARLGGLERILPDLLAINNRSAKKPRVTFYEGVAGLKEVYSDMLRAKQKIIAYEDLSSLQENLPKDLFDWFPAERAKRDIEIHTISRDTPFARGFSKDNTRFLRKTKFLKSEEFGTDINIYGNKVALISLGAKPPFCVVIEDASLASTMQIAWTGLWERLESEA